MEFPIFYRSSGNQVNIQFLPTRHTPWETLRIAFLELIKKMPTFSGGHNKLNNLMQVVEYLDCQDAAAIYLVL
jgi:hypothetical protein